MGRTKCAATSESLTLKGGNKGKGKDRASHTSPIKTGFDGRMDAPWQRQVAYSLRLPCTLIHTTSNGTEKTPSKNATNDREKVRQVFWAKSLEGLCAMVPVKVADKFLPEPGGAGGYIPQRLELPPRMEIMAPSLDIEGTAATFCTALHSFDIYGTELTGQTATRKQIEENPFDSLKFNQPFVQIPTITEQDISQQERRVLDARKRLQELRKSFVIR
ncbi:unnamed protein product [Meloidogyne enterolobii]|uniref:Uncharacterized protein n=2 Tax=Meloidogyne enterolobii TaxID=390850 RepID=A0ACB0ZA45_MELEN|nr:unnamed protein product [Meloidogyne enterolobii]